MDQRKMRPKASKSDGPSGPPQRVNQAEFADLFQASFRMFWYIAVGIVQDQSLAEDVVQDAAVIALGKLGQFRAGTNFRSWMGQIVQNVALNQGRRERLRRTSMRPAAEIDAMAGRSRTSNSRADQPHLAVGPTIPNDEFDDRVLHALAGVGDVARSCLLLRTLEGAAYSEISELLGIPIGTAMSHVHRARQYMRERLAATMPDAATKTRRHD